MGGDVELSRYYLGTAQIRLKHLSYCPSSIESDECTGCSISDLEHNLPVLITLSEYHESLARSGVLEYALYQIGPPRQLYLPTSSELPCLHGRFRLECARKADSSELDAWWAVDLYESDAPTKAIVQLRQLYKRHLPLSDGEKYLFIRYYERKRNTAEALKWRKLVGTQMKNLNQILRNGWLCDLLEQLEPFRALWPRFQISSFPHVLSWRCSQEIEHYLARMRQMWHTITHGNVFWCDRNTIERLEGLAPRWSSRDRSVIENLFGTGQIFSRVKDPSARAQIMRETLAVDGLILSFRTFFKHVKVLGPIMLRLRELFPSSDLFPPRDVYEPIWRRHPSIKDILLRTYYNERGNKVNPCILQHSDQDERHIETSHSAKYAYWQLCLSLMRQEQGDWKLQKKGKHKQEILDYPEWLIRLGQLARKLGFESDKILLLCQEDPNLSQIRLFMREERPCALYSVSSDEFDAAARSRQRGQEIFKRRPDSPFPLMTTDSDTSTVFPRTHRALFLPTIWNALTQESRYALTEFGKLVLVLTTFFGNFGPSHGSSDYEASGIDVSQSHRPIPVDHTEQEAENLTRRSSSDYSMYDVQSTPVHPAPSAASSDNRMTFWQLPASRHIEATAKYTCPATIDRIKDVVRYIKKDSKMPPVFTMVAKNGQLQICPPEKISQRRHQSKQPRSVYYLYDKTHLDLWILQKPPTLHRVGPVPKD